MPDPLDLSNKNTTPPAAPSPAPGIFGGEIQFTPVHIPENRVVNTRRSWLIKGIILAVAVMFVGLAIAYLSKVAQKKEQPPASNVITFDNNGNNPWANNTSVPSGSTVKLVIWNLFDEESTFKSFFEEYRSERLKAGVTVDFEYHKFTNQTEYEHLLIDEIAAGKGPDIFAIHNTWLAKHRDKISPLPNGLDGPDGPMSPEKFRTVFVQAPIQDLLLKSAAGGEQVYALPLSVDSLALFYNAQKFRDFVLVDKKPAAMWDKIAAQVEKLNKPDNSAERFNLTGIALGRADNISRAVDIVSLLMLQKGAQIMNESQTTATFDSAETNPLAEAVNYYANYNNKLYNKTATAIMKSDIEKDEKEINLFAAGKVGMIVGFSYYADLIKNSIERKVKGGQVHMNASDVAVAPIPQFSKEGNVTLADYWPLTVSRNSAAKEESWNFLLYLASHDRAQHYFSVTKKPTARQDLIAEESQDETVGVFAQQASFAKSYPVIDDEKYVFIIKELITNITDGNFTTEDALKVAQDRYQCVLDKFNQKPGALEKDCLAVINQ